MVDFSLPLYEYAAPVWDEKKANSFAKKRERDYFGTPDPFPGYLKGWNVETRYNGGTVIEGEWYQGIRRPLPKVPDGFKWIQVISWGWRLIKTN